MRLTTIPASVSLLCFSLLSGSLFAADSPEEVYRAFHEAQASGDLDTMLQYAPASKQAEMDSYTPEQKKQMMAMMAKLLPREVEFSGTEVGT